MDLSKSSKWKATFSVAQVEHDQAIKDMQKAKPAEPGHITKKEMVSFEPIAMQ